MNKLKHKNITKTTYSIKLKIHIFSTIFIYDTMQYDFFDLKGSNFCITGIYIYFLRYAAFKKV